MTSIRYFIILTILFWGGGGWLNAQDEPPRNQIWYTTTNGRVVHPFLGKDKKNIKVISNTYKDGRGIIVFNDDITSIPVGEFSTLSFLRSIHLPAGVTIIKEWAFAECTSLEKVILPEGITKISGKAFSRCSSLREVEFPLKLSEIGTAAFEECNSLISIKFSSSLYELSSGAFSGCSSLESIHFEEGVVNLERGCFRNCIKLRTINLPSTLRKISEDCFQNCKGLETIRIPDGLEYLGPGAFAGCEKLRQFHGRHVLADGRSVVTSDGWLRAVALSGLSEYTTPNGVTKIADKTFAHSQLYRIFIQEGVDYIGEDILAFSENLESIYIPGTLSSTKNIYFCGCPRLKRFEGPLSSPDGQFLIKNNVLLSVAPKGLRKIVIPLGIYKIGDFAFSECLSLESVTLPETVNKIGCGAFYGCSSLKDINLPSDLDYIGTNAFKGCDNLKIITLHSFNPPLLEGRSPFNQMEVIYVPKETIDVYKTDDSWEWYFDIIKAY